jgi:Flp pilus assembly protein CpaB
MTYRLRNIAIAIALAVLAAMLTSFYVNQYKKDLKQNQEPTAVWVATEDIAAGATGAEVADLLEKREIAKEHVVPGAIVNPSDVQEKVVTEKIYAGEQVTELRFRSPAEQGIRSQLKGNLRAMQIPGDENQLIADDLREGDKVDVVGSWGVKVKGGAAGDDREITVSRVLLRDILVLRAPQTLSTTEQISDPEEASKTKTVMLAVTDAQAQKLWWIFTGGEWTLELRPTDDPSDSPESFETEGTMVGDGLTPPQVNKILAEPFLR